MPQETALIGELTIKETIYYFGKIFQVDIETLREQYKMLKNLLELPRGDQRVEECSGGQQRRVSFAAAMIHQPDLLILDEPTVGLDPILREKIWDFMLHVTRTSKLAIIITTHYIDEAKQADRCGLMRNGVLLAEDTPRSIISRHEVENLEEAFLKLCVKRGVSEEALEDDKIQANVMVAQPDNLELEERVDQNRNPTDEDATEPTLIRRKKFAWSTMRALFTKNYLQMKRQPA
jgi:ABC-type multidrug transport system ATPase subunit